MFSVGINGFGRIGKLIFIQLLNNKNCKVVAINAPSLSIKYMETYLKYDSVHKYNTDWNIKIIDHNNFEINGNIIHIFRNRNAKELDWKALNINYVIDATGSYLTTEKCKEHNVDYVIQCSPPKDNTPLFVYKVNHNKYNGENIVSNASCTTNCITPVLKFLDDKYKINNANFTTIHSTTASQSTVDTVNSNNRTHRSILNNIIPHSTGASSSIFELIPSLKDKVYGTSLRVPVSNVSLVDLNVELEENTTLENIMKEIEEDDFIQINSLNLVSSDFVSTKCPSIVDKNASMHLGGNRFKIMIWYDNEWSYSAQVIKLVEYMYKFNSQIKLLSDSIPTNNSISNDNISNDNNTISIVNEKYFIDNFNYKDKNVIIRVDWNIPTDNFTIKDDFRIVSSLKTINKVLEDKPNRVIIISHFGRPNGNTDSDKYSWKHYMEQIQKYFSLKIELLEDGLSLSTLDRLNNILDDQNKITKLYLLENVRFHDEETNYKKYKENNIAIQVINNLGDFYINDAFGCMHRDHLSICGITYKDKAYGYLVKKELDALNILMENKNNEKILAIVGGAKMDDKLPLLHTLSKKMNDIYIAGGNINSIIKNNMWNYIDEIKQNKANIHLMIDGVAAMDLDIENTKYLYYYTNELPNNYYFYDMSYESIISLEKLIKQNDIIFWNGTLGVVEYKQYEKSSKTLLNILKNSGKKVIVGGGDTAGYVNSYDNNFYFISTGGGALLDYISNGQLYGLEFFKI
jgi:glyceraldehyde 3-phosphate dehydrogenase